MKTFLSFLLFIFSINTFAKTATMHITIKNFKGSIYVYDPNLLSDLTKKRTNILPLDARQSAIYKMDIEHPSYLVLYFSPNIYFQYNLFLTPGDELFLSADFAKKDHQLTVTGKGSNNNQPEIFALTDMNTLSFKGDKTPDRLIAAINKQFLLNKKMLANYIKVNKPSAAFIKNAEINLKYFAPNQYYEFSHNNNLFKSKEELKPWLRIQDSLFATIKLSGDQALFSYNYDRLIGTFVMREAEALRMEYANRPLPASDTWLHFKLKQDNKSELGAQSGGFDKFVIYKNFSGKAAENAYAQTIKYKFLRADYPAVTSIFDQFKKEFPASPYVKQFKVPIAEIVKKQHQTLNSNTVFVANNGKQLNTLKEVLALTKGKVALVDMWGTWCSPCRGAIEQNAVKLENHFKNKGVNFIYIANFDTAREQEWKKMVSYFQIEGMQILANSALTKDIEGKTKSTSYPTYIIIRKDGSYRTTSAQLPINLPRMIKEIEVENL